MGTTPRLWPIVMVLVLAACPANGQEVSFDWMDHALEARCFGDDDRAYRERLIYAGRFMACPGFSGIASKWQLAPMPLDGIPFRDNIAECHQYAERSWRRMVTLANGEGPRAVAALCEHAKGWRDRVDLLRPKR